jgi:hypothetical protein
LLALKQKLHSSQATLDLPDAGNDAHRIEDFRRRLIRVVPLCYSEYETVTFERSLDCAKSSRSACRDGSGEPRKDYCSAKRQDGYSLTLCHVFP